MDLLDEILFEPPEPSCVLNLAGLPGSGLRIYDKSPYGNNGTLVGVTWKRLPTGLWYPYFDGTDDYIYCANSSSLNFGANDDFTIKFWHHATTLEKHCGVNKANTDASASGYYLMIFNTGVLRLYIIEGSDEYYISTGAGTVTAGVWRHFVGVMDKDNASGWKMYMNKISQSLTAVGTLADVGSLVATQQLWLNRTGTNYPEGGLSLVEIHRGLWTELDVQRSFDREKYLFGVW